MIKATHSPQEQQGADTIRLCCIPPSAEDQHRMDLQKMNPQVLHRMVRGILSTRPEEIGCDECFQHMNHYAELELERCDPAALLPRVKDHLTRCGDCREEYEVLLAMLQIDDE